MDAPELDQKLPHKRCDSSGETTREPLVSSENKNGSTRPGTRESAVRSSHRRITPSVSGARRSISTERKRASRRTLSPTTPPSSPAEDTCNSPAASSTKINGSKSPPEALWPPSTVRSLSVSFQSDSISVPTSKKEKPLPHRTVQLQPSPSRNSTTTTPERKLRSPSIENAKPVADRFDSRLVDRHRWPSGRSRGRLEKSSGDSLENRALSSSNPNLRPSPPSLTRRASPVRSFGGPSPARARPSSPSRQPRSTAASVLSFTADVKKGEKTANRVEEAHRLRMLYNRHLQWRYANARADASLDSQKLKTEKTLYSVWKGTVDLGESVVEKWALLQRLKIKSKLCSVLDGQLSFLVEWSSMEMDHANSLTSAVRDLRATTVRIPVTGGARGGVESVKAAMSAAVDVMQALESSVSFLLTKVEGMNMLASELAAVSAHERAMLDECESLLSSTNAMQVTEDSIRTHVIQNLGEMVNNHS